MDIVVFLAIGIALGTALGLFGGGGGILAVPLLLVAGVPADEAATTSLVVVGIGAAGGLIPHARAGRVDWRQGAVFGALGVLGAILGSRAALLADDALQLWAFAGLLVLAGLLMMRKSLRPRPGDDPATGRRGWPLVVATATGVGLITGFFGVGGGFLIVPALVLVLGMSLHRATATALLVIIINSAAAMIPRLGEALDVRASVVVAVAVVAASAVAARWSNKWSERSLGIGFASLVLAMAVLTMVEAASL